MKSKVKVPFQKGWTVKRSNSHVTGKIRQIREHLPVMIGVVWGMSLPQGSENRFEWVPVEDLVLVSIPAKTAKFALADARGRNKVQNRSAEWFSKLPSEPSSPAESSPSPNANH